MKRLSFGDRVGIVVMALLLVGCYLLTGCSGDENVSVLPTVPVPPNPVTAMVTCRDYCGTRPAREIQLARAERNPKFCFIGGECFFGCPPKRRCAD
jgi:hypothetical protein